MTNHEKLREEWNKEIDEKGLLKSDHPLASVIRIDARDWWLARITEIEAHRQEDKQQKDDLLRQVMNQNAEIAELKKPTVATVLAFEEGMKESGFKYNEELEAIAELLSKKKMGYYVPRITQGLDLKKDILPEFIGAGAYNDGMDDAASIVRNSIKKI